ETFLMLQIETPEAVARVEEIAAIPGVDGFFMGPGDLSLRLGCASDWTGPAHPGRGRHPRPGRRRRAPGRPWQRFRGRLRHDGAVRQEPGRGVEAGLR